MDMDVDSRPGVTGNSKGDRFAASTDGDSHGSRALKIDRQTTTPIIDEFTRSTVPVDDELVVYTWKDATLKELTNLIKEVHEDSRRRDARFTFRSYFCTNFRGDWQSKDLGTVYNSRFTHDDNVTLLQRKYQQGDIIDVAIHLGKSGIAAPEMEADRYDDVGRRRGSNDTRRY